MFRFEYLQGLLYVFWIAFLVSAALAYPIWKMLLLTKSRQTISEYAPEGHQAKQGTPTMGGLIIAAGYIAALLFTRFGQEPLPNGATAVPWQYRALVDGALILFAGFCLIGFVDDFVVPRMLKGKRGLGWKQKIVMQLGLAILGTGVTFAWNWPAVAMATFLVLFYSNAYNFSDGIDGLAGTLLIGLTLGICGVAWLLPNAMPVVFVVAPFAAATIPFLYLNAPPAKVFMGDVGSLPIGAVLGLAVAYLNLVPTSPRLAGIGGQEMSFGQPLLIATIILSLVMVAELVPPPLQILSVKLRKKKLFPYTPIHHAFEKAGWPETRVTAMFALTQFVLSLLAIGVMILHIMNYVGAR